VSDYAINLIPLRPGVSAEDFAAFSLELDQPALIGQDVVESFEVYAVEHATDGAPRVDVVEVLGVRSWEEWERLRDSLPELEPLNERFAELIDPDTVVTMRGPRIGRAVGA
jgi:hypothetical protein